MPIAAGISGPRHPDDETVALIDTVWGRLQARLEKGLSRVERSVSALFDRDLETAEIENAVALCDQLASKMGMLGLAAPAELVRRASAEFEKPGLSSADAIALSTLLDDARMAMASSVTEIKHVSHTDRPLAVVGAVSEVVDELLWVAAAHGLPVTHHIDGVVPTTEEAAAVLVVVDDPDLNRARPMLRSVRQAHPTQPVVLLAPPGRLADRAKVVDSITSILPAGLRPAEIVAEVRRDLGRSRQPFSVVCMGQGSTEAVAALNERGFDATVAESAAGLLDALRQDQARAALLTPGDGIFEPGELLRLIRVDRETRAAVVVIIGDELQGDRPATALRNGADHFFDLGLDPDELAVVLKARLIRRAQLEPVSDTSRKQGVVAWNTAVVMMERLLLTSFRQNMPVGVGLLQLRWGPDETDVDDEIAREFRGEDVISRLSDDLLIVGLQGASRGVLMRRLEDLHRKYGLADRRVRSVAVEFPADGRSLEELIEAGRNGLERAEIEEAPLIVGADWRPDVAESPDVMLIDPDRALGEVLSATLSRRGLTVVHHRQALDAMDALIGPEPEPSPRVVLMELDQRGLDGLQMLRQLREKGGLLRYRVIVLSNRTQESELQRAFELGAYDFVTKPFSTPLLLHRIKRILEG